MLRLSGNQIGNEGLRLESRVGHGGPANHSELKRGHPKFELLFWEYVKMGLNSGFGNVIVCPEHPSTSILRSLGHRTLSFEVSRPRNQA